MNDPSRMHGTTIIAVRTDKGSAIGGDGQVSLGETIMKAGARKIRKLNEGQVTVGFAGATADAFALLERFEGKLRSTSSSTLRSAVELAKDWRTDRVLQKLNAFLVVLDKEHLILLSGNGDVIEPDDGILAVGSGGGYALAAARAMVASGRTDAKEIVRESLEIASQICVYTNDNIYVEEV
ncbi:MAG: ATP-dependent protease subunit HslV [Planctomycetota bacterium]|nr:ATP-dependent protease subunit HslV [Planctomycetota bacterium]